LEKAGRKIEQDRERWKKLVKVAEIGKVGRGKEWLGEVGKDRAKLEKAGKDWESLGEV
jgi:hypothetical protein